MELCMGHKLVKKALTLNLERGNQMKNKYFLYANVVHEILLHVVYFNTCINTATIGFVVNIIICTTILL